MASWNALLDKHRLNPLLEVLAPIILPAIGFELRPVMDAAPVAGQSRAGGEPDLPPGFTWPAHAGRPLGFFLQLDLAGVGAVADTGLPKTGTLSFFGIPKGEQKYSGPDAKNFQVHYFDSRFQLQPTAPPSSPGFSGAPAQLIRFVEHLSIPDYSSPLVHPHLVLLAQQEANAEAGRSDRPSALRAKGGGRARMRAARSDCAERPAAQTQRPQRQGPRKELEELAPLGVDGA